MLYVNYTPERRISGLVCCGERPHPPLAQSWWRASRQGTLMLGGSSGLEFDSHLKIPKSRVGLESSSRRRRREWKTADFSGLHSHTRLIQRMLESFPSVDVGPQCHIQYDSISRVRVYPVHHGECKWELFSLESSQKTHNFMTKKEHLLISVRS